MLRLLLAILLTVMFVTFGMANTHHVELSLILGPPARINLIFLLMVTFLSGMVVSAFFGMISRLRLKRRLNLELAKLEQLREESDRDKRSALVREI